MRLFFLGTGAADWPLERPVDYTEFRRLSSAIVDDVLLIDPGPQVPESLTTYGKDLRKIRYIINTHEHGDHFNPATVACLQAQGAEFVTFLPFETKKLGDYIVTALQGNHGTCPNTLHYIIEDAQGHRLFYGLDGAWLLYEEVAAIKAHSIDYAVLDATIGDVPGDYRIFEHNNLNMVLEMQRTLAPYVKKFCISHMARTLHTDQKTLAETMAPYQIDVAYDGFEVII